MNAPPLEKVTAFVVSRNTPGRLLVFDHPLAGAQLPAGTVEPDESASDAVVREVFEETGVRVSDGALLGVDETKLQDSRAALLESANAAPATLRRGLTVEILGTRPRGGDIAIRYREFDHDTSPPTLLETHRAQVATCALTRRVRRSFFAFSASATDEKWVLEADGHTFQVSWQQMDRLELHEPQGAWLEAYREQLEELI